MTPVPLKNVYIGGGSRDWARKLMFDLALCPEPMGEVALYNIDMDSARLNEQLGNRIQRQPGVSWELLNKMLQSGSTHQNRSGSLASVGQTVLAQ